MLRLSASSRCSRRSTASCEATAALRLASATFNSSPRTVSWPSRRSMAWSAVSAPRPERLAFSSSPSASMRRSRRSTAGLTEGSVRPASAASTLRPSSATRISSRWMARGESSASSARLSAETSSPRASRRLPSALRAGKFFEPRGDRLGTRLDLLQGGQQRLFCSTTLRSDARSSRMAVRSERSIGRSTLSASIRRARSKVAPESCASVRMSPVTWSASAARSVRSAPIAADNAFWSRRMASVSARSSSMR